ncbi:MAG: GT4 family glycosyltransferase PelF [Candidatus Theseobacter exili]|nr:GT4 family glycosyltransferase PelF [Candidatus Theseobacter exili]
MEDVCLLLEGTYPYVSGGVSSWVYDLIKRMEDVTFSIVYLGAHRPGSKKMQYELPGNVVDFRELYLFDYRVDAEPGKKKNSKEHRVIENFLLKMKKGDHALFEELLNVAGLDRKRISLYDLVHSKEAWEGLLRMYESESEEHSFLDFFWTWRFVYLPFFSLLRLSLPMARVYHSVSTGYAGVLGSMAKIMYKRPFILTEHGIYTRERKIDISQAEWIYSETEMEIKVVEGTDFFKDWWKTLFSSFSLLAYDTADKIITLYEGNRKVQIEEGANPEITSIIPNGIDVDLFASLKKSADEKVHNIGFVGRVVPIKDIKTLLIAFKIIYEEKKNVHFWMIGPIDEDKDYVKECNLLIEMESLQDVVTFTGKVDVKEYYPKIDVLVLTSVSEGQPIVLLEAGACGIPAVATDVGSCSEILYGMSPEDQLLGPSGVITPIRNSKATAQAVLRILEDRSLYKKMSDTARKRIAEYYQIHNLIAGYKLIYNEFMEKIVWPE